MTAWFCFCGFERTGDRLLFEALRRCAPDAVRSALDASAIADDPGILNSYPIDREAVAALTGNEGLPEADYYVNASQGPSRDGADIRSANVVDGPVATVVKRACRRRARAR